MDFLDISGSHKLERPQQENRGADCTLRFLRTCLEAMISTYLDKLFFFWFVEVSLIVDTVVNPWKKEKKNQHKKENTYSTNSRVIEQAQLNPPDQLRSSFSIGLKKDRIFQTFSGSWPSLGSRVLCWCNFPAWGRQASGPGVSQPVRFSLKIRDTPSL